ncbi:two-component system regulatory protein YycI [Bacillus pumilus]|uniref:two-component system regulatory protein YycI n=1 Tax=Bacillus pumilus TaxID=1408 RepID=UPI00227FCE46|nr:two-component system regulatory protein YycI [Bacillus pumilus]MCY7501517.1 two-component system regulatory protein YycI [Bacillus pumilus]MCY7529840.1 two-component system regulatory protein YycI [Bacillus pumilus]MED4440579.1 two-component system regulatory protein YycI [Bacillus pumilus]MED4492605.1 two-component system regulatory protein YycI [Bacillus pumilus]
MEWNKTKTIFILAFLVLDIFLGFQYFEKRSTDHFAIIEKTDTLEEMKADGIKYGNLSDEAKIGYRITAEKKQYTKKDVDELADQKAKSTFPKRDKDDPVTLLEMTFTKPVALPKKDMKTAAANLVNQRLLDGKNYKLWSIDEETGKIVFFQTYKGKYIFQEGLDDSETIGKITLDLNDKNEVVSYQQSMVTSINEVRKETLVPALETVKDLYTQNMLSQNTTVKKVELGYYTQYPGASTQVMVPVWRVELEGVSASSKKKTEEEYLINAIDGSTLDHIEKDDKSSME